MLIKELKLEWEKKLLIQQDIRLNDKDKENLKYDSLKFKLLDILKKKFYPGPFSSPENQVKNEVCLS